MELDVCSTPPEPSKIIMCSLRHASVRHLQQGQTHLWPNPLMLSPSAHTLGICVMEQQLLNFRSASDLGVPGAVLVRSFDQPDALATGNTARPGAAWRAQGFVYTAANACTILSEAPEAHLRKLLDVKARAEAPAAARDHDGGHI